MKCDPVGVIVLTLAIVVGAAGPRHAWVFIGAPAWG